ncbi:MAG: hypothetical protein JNG85_17835 [Spirochaetaceae bacterium]|nr:hypothetical protein [Spirochaetaceae bacterium]
MKSGFGMGRTVALAAIIPATFAAAFALSTCRGENLDKPPVRGDFPGLLDYAFLPTDPKKPNPNFADLGAWQGICLPPTGPAPGAAKAVLGVTGPYLADEARWAGPWLSRFRALGEDGVDRFAGASLEASSEPGLFLVSAKGLGELRAELRTIFISRRSYLSVLSLRNEGAAAQVFDPAFDGALFEPCLLEGFSEGVATLNSRGGRLLVRPEFGAAGLLEKPAEGAFRIRGPRRNLAAGETARFAVTVSYLPRGEDGTEESALAKAASACVEDSFAENEARWNGYVAKAAALGPERYRGIAVKCVQVLLGNWKSPLGALRHSGLVPSTGVRYFNGFWAWDSWKHAAALAAFEPELAKEQVRAMFEFQNPAGMIADCAFPDSAETNWRNSKPPLAAWAVSRILAKTGDLGFVREVLPALERYHAWWYAERDQDGNGLCEYGSTDGSLEAARWESGMDDAARFDGALMARSGEAAWSMDRESVDLNAYLAAEKAELAALHRALGGNEEAARHAAAAAALCRRVGGRFYDTAAGWFFDRKADGAFVPGAGPEGWIPLWCGVADGRQAAAVARALRDPERFATRLPFPTLDAADPRFDPGAYWRGPVWLDQAYFAVSGLRRSGLRSKADAATTSLFEGLGGLMTAGPVYEHYDPRTGRGQGAPNFSWSAASLLLLYEEYGEKVAPPLR